MRVTSVTFRSSVQLKEYQHVHVEATASVADGEDPRVAMGELKAYVAYELKKARDGEKHPTGSFAELLRDVKV